MFMSTLVIGLLIVALIVVVAVFDPALAAVIAIMALGLPVVVVPLEAIRWDERERMRRRPG